MRLTLEAARVNAGLTQQNVAEALKVSVPTVRSWEKGKRSPKVSQFAAMCRMYAASMDDIILQD